MMRIWVMDQSMSSNRELMGQATFPSNNSQELTRQMQRRGMLPVISTSDDLGRTPVMNISDPEFDTDAGCDDVYCSYYTFTPSNSESHLMKETFILQLLEGPCECESAEALLAPS